MKSELPRGWEKTELGKAINLRRGHDLTRKNMNDKGVYPVMGSNGIIGKHNKFILEGPVVTVGRSGNVGTPFYYEGSAWPHNTTLYIDDFKGNNSYFIYYLLVTLNLKNYAGGSAVPTLNRNHIHPISINLAPLKEQKAIAGTLSSIDNKIELNNKINKNLETQAQAIFKHWFVDFEFPGENGKPYKSSGGEMIESELGMIPVGWKVKSLDEIADFLNGIAIAKFKPISETDNSLPALKIRELRQGFIDNSSDICLRTVDEKYIINDYDMIFSWSGSLLVDIWVGGEAILNQHLFKVTSKEYDQWYYYYWTKHFLEEFIQIARNKATTMGHINRSHLAEAKVLLPDETTYKELGQVLNNMLKLKMKNQKQNQKLAQLRDALLPKLMSGEIRIPLD